MQPGQAEFVTPSHHQYWYSAEKKGYSGTAIFAKKEPLSVRYGLGIEQHDHEGRAITLEYENFYLLNVYTPNSQRELTRLDYRMEWEDALRNYMMELDKVKAAIASEDLAADLNVQAALKLVKENAEITVKKAEDAE